MQKTIVYFVPITIFCSIAAMQEKSLWVKTTDCKPLFIKPEIIASSNLLTVLKKKYMGSYTHPVIIPEALSLNSADLELYCRYSPIPAKNLHKELTSDIYFKLIHAAEKLKALKKYIYLIRKILPQENDKTNNHYLFSSHITDKWINYVVRAAAIKEQHTYLTFATTKPYSRYIATNLLVSNDGTHIMHDFCSSLPLPHIEFYNTSTKKEELQHPTTQGQRTYFSPQSDYIVISNPFQKIYLYHMKTRKEYLLCKPENQESNITISDNGTYILRQGLAVFNDYENSYNLWCIDQNGNPEKIDLENDLLHSKSAIFHPDNKHILHIYQEDLYLYDIITHADKNLTAHKEKNAILYGDLVISPDKKHVICQMKNYRNTSLSDHINYVIINIEDNGQTSLKVTPACYSADLPPLCIPYKNLVAHCSGNRTLLQLLDKKAKPIGSRRRTGRYISALATDNSGDYLACGYSDGSIVLWDLSKVDKKITGKIIIASDVPIKKLMFTDHQLLFCQSKLELHMPTKSSGHAALWDISGNNIINFGNSVHDAHITKNGHTIIIIKNEEKSPRETLTLTYYNTNVPLPTLTLKQAYKFLQKNSLASCTQ